MHVRWVWCLYLGCVGLSLQGQQPAIDSLHQLLPSLGQDTQRVIVLRELGFSYALVDLDKAQAYADSALALAEALDYAWGIYSSQYTLGVLAYYRGDYDTALREAQAALEDARLAKDRTAQLKALNFLTTIHQSLNQNGQAIGFAEQALSLAATMEDVVNLATTYFNLGQLHRNIDNLETARTHFLKALALFEEGGDVQAVATVNQALAVISEGEAARDYAQLALDRFIELGNVQGQAICYSTLANYYVEKKEYEPALRDFERSLALCQQLDFKYGIASNSSNIGHMLTLMGRPEAAYPYLVAGERLARELNTVDILPTIYQGWINYYAARSQTDSVQASVDSLLAFQDTLYGREKSDLLIQAETRYQVREREAQMNLELERQKRVRNLTLLGAGGLLLLLVLLFQFFRNRQNLRRKEAEMAFQLEKAEADKLRELDQVKSNFFANISHEFRTPLTLILNPIAQVQDALPASQNLDAEKEIPVKGRYLSLIQRSARRLEHLVDQLLDLARLEAGGMQLKVQRGDLLGFLRHLVFSFESLAVRNEIAFEAHFPEIMPEAWFDRDKLEKILVNLLSNAFKFTPRGGKITVTIHLLEDRFLFKVSDSGKGMSEEESARIFDRFYRAEGTEVQGTGIGLSLVKELVDLYRGMIRVESEKGRGTTFEVSLPYPSQAFEAHELEEAMPETGWVPERARLQETAVLPDLDGPGPLLPGMDPRPLLLIVEDNQDLRTFLGETMNPFYRVLKAANGKEGLSLAIEEVPDLIISDVMMPEMDGYALCETLKTDERTSHIPIILLTAKAGQEQKVQGLETGADDYLTKPFDARELKVRVANLIRQRALLKEKFGQNGWLHPEAVSVTSADERFLRKVGEVIEARMADESFSVEDLADAVAFSRSQLHRKLKALTGKGPNEIIRHYRLSRAKSLLEQGAGTVSEIAFSVGYANISYFTKSFKQAFGQLPSEIN